MSNAEAHGTCAIRIAGFILYEYYVKLIMIDWREWIDLFMLFLHIYHSVVSIEDSHFLHYNFGKSIQIYEDRKYELFPRTKSLYTNIKKKKKYMYIYTPWYGTCTYSKTLWKHTVKFNRKSCIILFFVTCNCYFWFSNVSTTRELIWR